MDQNGLILPGPSGGGGGTSRGNHDNHCILSMIFYIFY